MESYVSLSHPRFFYSNLQSTFKIPVAKHGKDQCSVSISLEASNIHPSAMQYIGIERVLEWEANESGLKYAEFEFLETAHSLEYLTITLKNFLRCKPQNISQAIAAIGDPKYRSYPALFAGFALLSSETMQRHVSFNDGVYTTTYTFPLTGDSLLGEVRTINRESVLPPYKYIEKYPEWQAIIAVSDSAPMPDNFLEIWVLPLN